VIPELELLLRVIYEIIFREQFLECLEIPLPLLGDIRPFFEGTGVL